jgi:opacity protein-like surface antigen
MKRFAGVASLWLVGTLCVGVASAHAQTTGSDQRIYAEFHGGPTLGHKSDTFIGGEAGLRIVFGLDAFIEGGQMKNVGTDQLDTAAALIATCCIPGGTVSSTSMKVNYVNFGVRYHLNMIPRVHPYVLVGAGSGRVTTQATFMVNGTVVDPAAFGVQVGGDLAGTTRKNMLIAGFGVNVPFLQRFYGDIGYRYGQVFSKIGEVETDTSLKTQRVLLGVGVRF